MVYCCTQLDCLDMFHRRLEIPQVQVQVTPVPYTVHGTAKVSNNTYYLEHLSHTSIGDPLVYTRLD